MSWLWRILLALTVVFLLAFPYGPLFPWSPIRPGYREIRLQRADVYYPDGVALDGAYMHLDTYIAGIEQFQGLKMPKRITVVACRDWNDFQRFMPQLEGRTVGAVTLQTGTVIYVTPKLRERGLDTGEFLRHELSHAALDQNQSLLRAFELGKQQWFAEGLAVMAGRQKAYINAAEFTDRARHGALWPVFDGSTQADMRFAYQAWRYFLEYLIQRNGRDAFLALQRGCLDCPRECREQVSKVYGDGLEGEVSSFQAALQSGAFVPVD